MNSIIRTFFLAFTYLAAATQNNCSVISTPKNSCISFSIGPDTGCAWMCNYCASQLATSGFYFTDGVCSYKGQGCVGNPQVGVQYTCCSL